MEEGGCGHIQSELMSVVGYADTVKSEITPDHQVAVDYAWTAKMEDMFT